MEQSELAMVNALLESIEETTVQTIDKSHPDVQFALDIWAENSVAVQSKGWWYNREEYQLTLDSRTGEVFLPSGVLEVDTINTRYVKRGRRLYDKEDHTFIFTDNTVLTTLDLKVGCIMEWSIDELPPSIYRYTLLLSKIDIVAEREQDQIKLQKLEAQSNIALALAQKADLRYNDPNRQTVNNAGLLIAQQSQRFRTVGYSYE